MFDRICQAAEQVASRVSRRGFLGRLARLAGGTALAVAGVLAASQAKAAPIKRCCYYACGYGGVILYGKSLCLTGNKTACRPGFKDGRGYVCSNIGGGLVADCSLCSEGGFP